MSNSLESNGTAADAGQPNDGRKHSPPAFLDLADSAARLGSNMSDISARVELKRMEHERQRLLQRKMFENQMRALEQQQRQELLSLPYDGSVQHVAVSAPTTPPRQNATLSHGDHTAFAPSSLARTVDADLLSKAVNSATSDKRKSVTYAADTHSPEMLQAAAPGYGRMGGHKSMPASRRTSASSQDEELAGHLNNLSLIGSKNERERGVPMPGTPTLAVNGQYRDSDGVQYGNAFNAGILLDEQLDQEMHNAMRNLPTPADDKFSYSKTSSAALDLAPLSQASSRQTFMPRGMEQAREKASEWPQFESGVRGPEGIASRAGRRTATNPTLGGLGDKLNGSVSASATPLLQQGLSRRGSPLGIPDHHLASMAAAARSVPGTPLGNGMSGSVASHLMKSGAATPLLTDPTSLNGRMGSHMNESPVSAHDLQASLARLGGGGGGYDSSPVSFNSIRSGLEDPMQQYDVDAGYGLGGGLDNGRFNGGSSALYGSGGPRYGLGMSPRSNGSENKMNGLHGPKHKRGEIDREFNRFAGTRLEDLAGEIPSLCKDQHGCRYLQKKLEEGLPEHRDMIFQETFGHFADLMTDPFGNYLCQKLLEFATDEQRNLICGSVAQDLVNISLNMHGTRAVQKMIDFLSTRRQPTDLRYHNQIHSIIVALSLHVVVLIKDLNGNHVIQKCLNKLAPEDNQFIYNAVAANCVEVATHRHGCCVLQRCIDHASDHQRVQLVNEITYNALTLVQDPYGNYVVQYILDLNDNRFSDGVIRQFTGNICALSVQKFSSNVIEKCIRVAEHSTRKIMIDELLNRTRLEKLLRDSYGNYCVQTALDYADPQQRTLLVEGIRPVLPLIRNTPYGKRIQNKLQREQMDHYGGGGGGSGGYSPVHHGQPVGGMGYAAQGMGPGPNGLGQGQGRHMHQGGSLGDVYASPSGGMYSLGQSSGLGQAHLHAQPMHAGLHSHALSSMDPYALQGPGQGLAHAQGGYGSFGGANSFGNGGLSSTLHQPAYQRSSFGYGM